MTHKNVVRISGFVAPLVAPESRRHGNNEVKLARLVAPKSKKKRKNEIKFTDLSIKNLKVSKRETFYCEGLDGFGIRVTPKGTKTWILLYRFEGQIPQRHTIGRYPKISLAEARKEYGIAMSKIQHGTDPNREAYNLKKKKELEITVDELISKYIEHCKAEKQKCWKEKERALKRDASPTIGNMKAIDVSFREISTIVNAVFKERKSIEGAKHLLSYLRTMFKYSKNNLGLIEVNPCADLSPPARPVRKPPRTLSPQEIYLFWNNLTKTRITQIGQLGMKFMLCTLQRGVEVRLMKWSEVNMKDRIWIIPSSKAKNGIEHLVPLNSFAMDILDEVSKMTSHSEYVFAYSPIVKMNPKATKTNLKPLAATAFNHALRVNFDLLEIQEKFTPHELRKTGATRLTSVGFSRDIVKKILNHKPNDVTSVYDQFDYFEEKRAGMECMNYMLERILNSQSVEFVPSVKTLRREITTKGLIHEFMKEDYYNPIEADNSQGFQTTLLNPVSYSLSASLSEL